MPATRWDGARILQVHAVLLLALPSGLVVGQLGGAGGPATLVGLGCLAWWAMDHLARPVGRRRSTQPVRLACLVFLIAVAASYVAATVRPIEGAEHSTLTLGMVFLLSWCGVLLVANDGIPDADRLLAVSRTLVMLVGAMALLAIVQFATGQVLVDKLEVPGLVANHQLFGLTQREGFTRPAGTASHPIEYGAVLTMVLPLALALAIGDTRRSWLLRWLPVVLMTACVPLSVSRSALLSGGFGVLFMMVSWPRRMRLVGLSALGTAAIVIFLLLPGMLGSLLGLFTRVGADSSAASRVGSYAIAGEFIERSPIFGRGFSTFLPSYRILDNQYLGLLIETGMVGLSAFVALVAAGVLAARSAERRASGLRDAQLSRGIRAGVLAGALTMALFDGLSFSMAAATLFLMIGLAGAARRIHRLPSDGPVRVGLATPDLVGLVRRRWYVAGAGVLVTASAMFLVHAHPGVYTTQTAVMFMPPSTDVQPNTLGSSSASVIATAGLVERLVNGGVDTPATTSVVTLVGRGVREGSSVELPNTGGQWVQNFTEPLLLVQVTGPTAHAVGEKARALVRDVDATAVGLQSAAGVRPRWMITTRPSPDEPVVRFEKGHRDRALLMTLILGIFLTLAACAAWERGWSRRRNRQ